MKKGLIMIIFIIIIISNLWPENQISKFDGGKFKLDLSFYNSYLSGVTARSRNFGGTVSSAVIDPALNVLNPAGLGYVKESMLAFDLAPGFSFDLSSTVKTQVNDAVDEAIKDMESPTIQKKYPDMALNAGQSGWLNNLSVTHTGSKFGNFGFTWYRPFYLEMEFVGNALEFVIEDSVIKNPGQTTEYVEKTVLPLSMELFSNMKISMQTANLSWGKAFSEKTSVGMGLNVNNLNLVSGLDAKIGGFIRQYGGDTDINVTFDDPNVSYRNTMNDTLRVNFENNFIGSNYAFSWHPSEKFFLDIVFNTAQKSKLNGDLYIVQHSLGAMKMDYDEDGIDNIPENSDDEEMFDVELLKPSALAFTNRTIYLSKDLTVNMPGGFTIATTYIKKNMKLIFSYEVPIGELSLDYKCKRYRDGQFKDSTDTFIAYSDTTSLHYKVGLKPKQNIKMAIGWKNFAMSAQLYICDQIAEGLKDKDGLPVEPMKNIIIPSIALGTGFNVSKNVLMDINIIALPNPFFRTTLTWKF